MARRASNTDDGILRINEDAPGLPFIHDMGVDCGVDHADATCDACCSEHVEVGYAHLCHECWTAGGGRDCSHPATSGDLCLECGEVPHPDMINHHDGQRQRVAAMIAAVIAAAVAFTALVLYVDYWDRRVW